MWGSCRTEGIILNRFLLNADPTQYLLLRPFFCGNQGEHCGRPTRACKHWYMSLCLQATGVELDIHVLRRYEYEYIYIYAYVCLEY